jgi:hypothetical protein
MNENLEKQKELASIIKGIHHELRVDTEKHGSEVAWKCHLENKEKLDLYAKTMKSLSENHWKNKSTTNGDRIEWIIKYTESYFQSEQMKDQRSKDLEIIDKIKSEGNVIETFEINDNCYDKLKVIDVGSCANFFKKHERFDILPIDIAPSTSDVYYCDFTSATLSETLTIEDKSIKSLPKNHFHVAIFCLLLEYLPTSEMRVSCCERAYEVLAPEGILIIITPDSSHAGKNAQKIKMWKFVLAKLGFKRIALEKMKNLNCMVFRKSISKDISKRWATLNEHNFPNAKLEIPQDNRTEKHKASDDTLENSKRQKIDNE